MLRLPKKYAKMIAGIHRESEDEIMIYTQPGFCISDNGCHTYGVDKVSDIKEAIKNIRPCNCDDCGYEVDAHYGNLYLGIPNGRKSK